MSASVEPTTRSPRIRTAVNILKKCVEKKEQYNLEMGRYDSINHSMGEVARQMNVLTDKLKEELKSLRNNGKQFQRKSDN